MYLGGYLEKYKMVEPTPTEIARQQNLPAGIRGRPPEEIQARQSIRGGQSILGTGGRVISDREIQKQQEWFGF